MELLSLPFRSERSTIDAEGLKVLKLSQILCSERKSY